MSHEIIHESIEYPMSNYAGTYLGFAPTDESAIGVGEIEATISGEGIKVRMATGLEITDESIETSETSELSKEEICFLLGTDEKDDIADGIRVFKVADLHWMFFNTPEAPQSPQLLIFGGMGDAISPTLLFGPSQVAQGIHTQAYDALEADFGAIGEMPRINNLQ